MSILALIEGKKPEELGFANCIFKCNIPLFVAFSYLFLKILICCIYFYNWPNFSCFYKELVCFILK